MTVRCPKCSTQYRVPEDRLNEADPVFRCARCKTVFSPAEEKKKKRSPRKSAEPQDPPNLAFDFDKVTEEAEPDEDQPAFVDGLAASETDDAPAKPARKRRRDRASANEENDAAEEEDETVPDTGEEEGWDEDVPWEEDDENELSDDQGEIEDDEIEPEPEEDDEEEPVEPPPARPRVSKRRPRRAPVAPRPAREAGPTRGPSVRSPLRPVGWSVALLCLFYLGAALTFTQRPEIAQQALAQIPVLGKLLQQDHLLAWRIELRDLRGGPDTIKGNKVAWVVTGRAVNNTEEDIRLVEIEGELIAGGKPRATRTVYAANQAVDTIRDLSISEVDMLLRLEPNRRFRIPPGESASFLIVFPDPPADTSEVVCRVVEARTS